MAAARRGGEGGGVGEVRCEDGGAFGAPGSGVGAIADDDRDGVALGEQGFGDDFAGIAGDSGDEVHGFFSFGNHFSMRRAR